MTLLGDALPYVGGGSVGFLLFVLGLFLTKKLPSPMERELLIREDARKAEIIKEKEEYIKKLVQDLADVSDTLRNEVVPAQTAALSTLTRFEQEMLVRRSVDK